MVSVGMDILTSSWLSLCVLGLGPLVVSLRCGFGFCLGCFVLVGFRGGYFWGTFVFVRFRLGRLHLQGCFGDFWVWLEVVSLRCFWGNGVDLRRVRFDFFCCFGGAR